MILTHIKHAFRNLFRDYAYSAINIGGLSLGIAASIMLMLWVQEELSFDTFHQKADQIYHANANFDTGSSTETWPTTPGPLAAFAKREIPGVQEAVRVQEDFGTKLFSYNNKDILEDKVAYADNKFFSVFDFQLLKGNREKPFPNTKSIILTESIAKKFFGDDDAIGKVIQLDNKDEFTVSGIAADFPVNSSMQYNILFPFDRLIETYQSGGYWKSLESDWGDYYYHTYFQLDPGTTADAIAKQLTGIHTKNQTESGVQYTLQPLTNMHLYEADGNEAGMQTVRIFLIVALSILLIACINYINLATARATRRAKEVGVRKTIGADRSKLISQFLTESGIISVVALLTSFVIIQLLIPFYNMLSGKTLSFDLSNPTVLILVFGALLVTWLTSGIYPALILSSFKPMEVIRGKLTISGGNSTFRKILVVTQFSLSIIIIIGTLVIGEQLTFIRNKRLGFSKENIFQFGLRGEMFGNAQTIKNELLSNSAIADVSFGNQNILEIANTTGDTDWKGKGEKQTFMIHPMNIDESFMSALNLKIIEGKNFTGAKTDTAGYILNETAVKEAGIQDPIGKYFKLWDREGTIIGVVEDFNHQSIHKKIEPTIFFSKKDWLWLVYVKANPGKNQEAVAAVEAIWKKYNPDYPLDYNFLDVSYDKMYQSEQRMGKLFTAFSFVAICISCLGLFGLATFTAMQRIKEIGIRKVMGASINQIVMLLSKDFLLLVIIAFAIATPVSYYAMENWLADFAYRTSVPGKIYVITGVTVFALAFFTISFQTIKAALSNPVDSLRNE